MDNKLNSSWANKIKIVRVTHYFHTVKKYVKNMFKSGQEEDDMIVVVVSA